MNSFRDYFERNGGGLGTLVLGAPHPVPERLAAPVTMAERARLEVERPAWAVERCIACERWLRLSAYVRCRECGAAVCRAKRKCGALHQAQHRVAKNRMGGCRG